MKSLSRFPPEAWSITEKEYCPDSLEKNASIFFTGNGFLGMRGGLEETTGGSRNSHKGTFINGFYETGPQVYGEAAYGFPEERQAMLNLPDPSEIRLYLDDEPFNLDSGRVVEYERGLRMAEGVLRRELLWESPEGRRIRFESMRCVCFERQHLALISLKLSELSGTERLRLVSSVYTGTVSHKNRKSDPRTGAGFIHSPLETTCKKLDGGRAFIAQRTVNSGLSLATAVSNVPLLGLSQVTAEVHSDRIDNTYEGEASEGGDFVFDKFISYYSSLEAEPKELGTLAREELDRAESTGGRSIISEQNAHMSRFWEAADVVIGGEEHLQQGIRYNIFALYQSAGRDGRRNVAAKGLSGEGYEGHYFWDTEIYVIPFFTYTFPKVARKLLEYRYNILDQARERAGVLNEKGALFPWRTINGLEASAYFPAGTAQYHINADIAYGIQKYIRASGDEAALKDFGAEILVETSRLWMSLGNFDRTGSFSIDCVTGPDEYTAIVNNNYFTNIMAADNLEYASAIVGRLSEDDPEWYKAFAHRLGITSGEAALWRKAADSVCLPYDEELCVHAQDDSFMRKERWDFAGTPAECYPLLLHFHPLVIYRHQVLKQPDVVLANFLQGRRFSRIQKLRDYDYYNPLTTGDSSLAPCIQSIMAVELGRVDEAYDYFMKTARMDLDDINSNVADGVHITAMGGTWLSLVYGFAGFRDSGGEFSFSPRLPASWDSLSFKLLIGDELLSVEIDHTRALYSLESPADSGSHGIEIRHRGSLLRVMSGAPVEISMKPRLEAVIFDLDGVITDTSEFHYQAWKRLADERGYEFSREINEKLRGIGRLESLDIILEASDVRLSAEERFRQGELKNGYYKELLKTIKPENILPGISAFLKDLRKRNIRTALASASRNAPEVIKRLGIGASFDVIMDAAAVEKGKPDPEIFVSAAEALGAEPENCVGVEDAEAGVESIRAAGIFSVGIGGAASAADWTLGETSELRLDKLIEKFSAGD